MVSEMIAYELIIKGCFLGFSIVLFMLITAFQGIQDPSSITMAAEKAIGTNLSIDGMGRVHVKAAPLDSRLRLPLCAQRLTTGNIASNIVSAGRYNVQVRCDTGQPWRLFVPVTVEVFQPVVVTRKPLMRGDTIREDDVIIVEKSVSTHTRVYFRDVSLVVGRVVKRGMDAGEVVNGRQLEPAYLVQKGDEVEVVVRKGMIRVSIKARALDDGELGEIISIYQSANKSMMDVKIVGDGKVEPVGPARPARRRPY